MGIIIPLLFIFICCLIIWKASDGFEVSSEYLGRNLSDGVRGATINAIASSMPELFTTIFFLLEFHLQKTVLACQSIDLSENKEVIVELTQLSVLKLYLY